MIDLGDLLLALIVGMLVLIVLILLVELVINS